LSNELRRSYGTGAHGGREIAFGPVASSRTRGEAGEGRGPRRNTRSAAAPRSRPGRGQRSGRRADGVAKRVFDQARLAKCPV